MSYGTAELGQRADNVALPAISPATPARRAHSSKPALEACGGRMGQTDRHTDGRTDARQSHRPCSAYYAGKKVLVAHTRLPSVGFRN